MVTAVATKVGVTCAGAAIVATATEHLSDSSIMRQQSKKADYTDDENATKNKIGKQRGNTPRNNQKQNKQFKDVCKKLKLKKDEAQVLHHEVGHWGLGYQELLDFAKDFFGK